jgi:hypothetical protein
VIIVHSLRGKDEIDRDGNINLIGLHRQKSRVESCLGLGKICGDSYGSFEVADRFLMGIRLDFF